MIELSIRHVKGSHIPDIFHGDRKVATVWPATEGIDPDAEQIALLFAGSLRVLETLKGLVRIVDAFSYTTQLGKTQKARLEEARTAIASSTGKEAA